MQGVTDYGKDAETGYHIAVFFKNTSLDNYIGKARLMNKPLGVGIIQFADRVQDVPSVVKGVMDSIAFDERARDTAKSRYYPLMLEADEILCLQIQQELYEGFASQGIQRFYIAFNSFDPNKNEVTPQTILDDLEMRIKKQMQQ